LRLLVAPDSFKESVDATTAADALAAGWRAVRRGDDVVGCPLADGGEGTAAALHAARGGDWMETGVTGPLGQRVTAGYAMLPDQTAVIDMASAAGLALLAPESRCPMRATTFGVGELMLDACARGARCIVVGLGGSATVDGGAGMAQALGFRLLDAHGRDIPRGGGGLVHLDHIRPPETPLLNGVHVRAACDVRNLLTGPEGAAQVYGPQKGASPSQCRELDAHLGRLAAIAERELRAGKAEDSGAGAAGGLGFGLTVFAGATLESGFDLVARSAKLDDKLEACGLVLTGEGRIDAQSGYGKVLGRLAERCRARGVPLVAFCGALGPGCEALYGAGVARMIVLDKGPFAETASRLRDAAARLAGQWSPAEVQR